MGLRRHRRHPHRNQPLDLEIACGTRPGYSGKHHRHGGNIQVVTDPCGFPAWTSPVAPGSTHDITAAREHAFPALYPAAAGGMPTLADKGFTGAGIGIHVPLRGANLAPDNQARNLLITALRAPAERANALFKSGLNRRVTLCPWRIGDIVAAAWSSSPCNEDAG